MALGLAHRTDDDDFWGRHQRLVYVATGDASYPAGGYPLGRDVIQAGNVRGVRCIGANAAGATLLPVWDHETEKLRVYYPSGGATAAPAALADPIVTTGGATASAVDAVTPNITPGRGKEVLTTTDLSTCKWLLEVMAA